MPYHEGMRLLSILALACAAACAQAPKKSAPAKTAPAPAPDKWPVEKLAVEGNHMYTADQVLGVAALKIGQLAGKPEFEAARDRLVASGAFETVGYKFEAGPDQKGYIATFHITEVQPAFPVRF